MTVQLPITPRNLQTLPLRDAEIAAMLAALNTTAQGNVNSDPVTATFINALYVYIVNRRQIGEDINNVIARTPMEVLLQDQYGNASLELDSLG